MESGESSAMVLGRKDERRVSENRGDRGEANRQRYASSFTDFYERNLARLYGTMIVVSRDPHVAEETCQEAFARVWRSWSRVSGMKSPEGYLFRTAMNVFFDERRRDRRMPVAIPDSGPADAVELVEGRTILEQALLALPDRQRAALVITEMLGYSTGEAAWILRVRQSTIRTLASLARRQLAGWLKAPEVNEDE